jgi:hypothetical protein
LNHRRRQRVEKIQADEEEARLGLGEAAAVDEVSVVRKHRQIDP